MKDRMRRDWVYPILDDIRAFLYESDLPEMAQDIELLLEKYGEILLADSPATQENQVKSGEPTRIIKFPLP